MIPIEKCPLRVLITDSAEPFQLGFAEQAATLLVDFAGVNARPSARGLILLGATERDLFAAAALLEAIISTAHIGTVEIVYQNEHALEPYFQVHVTTPEPYVNDVIAALIARRGLIEHVEESNQGKTVFSKAPVSTMRGFDEALSRMTAGRATVEYAFIGHEPTSQPEPPTATNPSVTPE